MKERFFLIGILVKDADVENIQKMQRILSEYGRYIKGRMGIPMPERKENLISVFMISDEKNLKEIFKKIKDIDGIEIVEQEIVNLDK